MGRLDGKVAIVTGAGRGIGRGIALRYAAEGVKVAVASRTKPTVDSVVDEIERSGGTAVGIGCDVGYQEQVNEAVRQAVGAFGGVDILVNAAQGFGTEAQPTGSPIPSPLENFSDAEWEYTLRTGATGTFWAMKAVFPFMKDKGGRIINFGSQMGVVGWEGSTAYNAAKEAVRALTRTAAREWGKYKINVNCINPMVWTDAVSSMAKEKPEIIKSRSEEIPLRRWGDAYGDAGGLAIFLAEENSSYLTGMTFYLDGGYTASA